MQASVSRLEDFGRLESPKTAPKAALVAGSVQNSSTNQPVRGATVVLVPKEKERQGIFALYQQTTADQHGRFTFKSVVPGDRVYAWEDVESSAWMDPEFMKPLEEKGPVILRVYSRFWCTQGLHTRRGDPAGADLVVWRSPRDIDLGLGAVI